MSRFTGPLAIRELDVELDTWELLQELVWEQGELGSGKLIGVPIGFDSDGASIPRPFSWILHRWGRKVRRPACLHDYGYLCIALGTPHIWLPTKAACDTEFRRACIAMGTWKWLAWVYYWCVYFFGDPERARKRKVRKTAERIKRATESKTP